MSKLDRKSIYTLILGLDVCLGRCGEGRGNFDPNTLSSFHQFQYNITDTNKTLKIFEH